MAWAYLPENGLRQLLTCKNEMSKLCPNAAVLEVESLFKLILQVLLQ